MRLIVFCCIWHAFNYLYILNAIQSKFLHRPVASVRVSRIIPPMTWQLGWINALTYINTVYTYRLRGRLMSEIPALKTGIYRSHVIYPSIFTNSTHEDVILYCNLEAKEVTCVVSFYVKFY